MSVARDQLLNLFEITLGPLVLVLSLWAVALSSQGSLAPHHVILALIVFSLTFPGSAQLNLRPMRVIRYIIAGWLSIAGLLFFFGYVSGYVEYFERDILLTWL